MKKINLKLAISILLVAPLCSKLAAQGGAATNNYTGGFLGWTNTNSINPLFLRTNFTDRMAINGNKAVGINGYGGQVTNGFIGIGANSAAQGFPFNAGNAGPFSLLHLNSGVGNFVQSFGWRPWMRFGITSTHNQDLMFMGQRQNPTTPIPNGYDITDAVIGWADNGTDDNMVFDFLSGGNPFPTSGSDLNGTATNGREIMRLTGLGNVGIGPRFNNAVQPQSTLHQHQENSAPSWMQITNQLSGGTASSNGPTPVTSNDGLRWGINGANTAYIYNQENNHLLFSTNNLVGNAAATAERMRITHIGAPGITNPGGIPANITRVSISHNPAAPVTKPLSLLHLGYNTGGVSASGASTDGWRPWMDIGMFVTNNTDHVYIGLKDEHGLLGDRQDAVISWGDNQTSTLPPGNGPDHFRIIFTSNTTSGGSFPATGPNGLEGLRMTPTLNTGIFTGIGGDLSAGNLYSAGTQTAGNTLEVNSWGATAVAGGSSGLRFTNLTTASQTLANPGQGVLSVNALGDVIYVPQASASALANVDNGLSTSGPTAGFAHLGQDPAASGNPGRLLNTRELPLNSFNLLFSTDGRIGLGAPFTGGAAVVQAKLDIRTSAIDPVGLRVLNNVNMSTVPLYTLSGIQNRAQGTTINYGVYSEAAGSPIKAAIAFQGYAGAPNVNNWGIFTTAENGSNNQGGNFNAGGVASSGNTGVVGNGNSSNGTNNGGAFQGGNPSYATNGYNGVANYGVFCRAFGGVNSYGIYAESTGGSTASYAGYFNNDVFINGTGTSPSPALIFSDKNLKENITAITNPLSLLMKLKPVSYNMSNSYAPQLHVDVTKTYGLIAQEVASVIPELVKDVIVPAVYDSLGTVTTPSVALKSMNYTGLIPITISGIQQLSQSQSQQQLVIDSLKDKLLKQESINQKMQEQLEALAAKINDCCSKSTARTAAPPVNQQDVELNDNDAIVLDQNVPNPFAEQTSITYNIPENVGKAQLIFYNNAGQMIRAVDIKTRGRGRLNVFASDLSHGLYHYTLIADGKIIDSKKMIRE